MKQQVIWCLYDDGHGSWNKLKLKNVFSLGINDNDWENYFKIDLSLNNINLEKDLKKIEKITGPPDLIIAHPPCESWSIADNQRRCYRSINRVNNEISINFFAKEEYFKQNKECKTHLKRMPHRQLASMLIGISTASAIDYIINKYKVHFVIENPATSKIWDYFKVATFYDKWDYLFLNKTYYNNWDSERSPKPTIFLSSFNFNYTDEQKSYKPNKKTLSFGRSGTLNCDYDEKSSVPSELLKKILEEFYKIWIIQEAKKDMQEKF